MNINNVEKNGFRIKWNYSSEQDESIDYEGILDKLNPITSEEFNRLSENTSLFEREILGERVNPTCKDCANFIGGGDWNLCCTVKRGFWLCHEDTKACEKFVWKR